MLLESIEAHNFRNLSGEIFWGGGLNVIHGENGQGKTNWLEAIYLCNSNPPHAAPGKRRYVREHLCTSAAALRAPATPQGTAVTPGPLKTLSLTERARLRSFANSMSSPSRLTSLSCAPGARGSQGFLDRGWAPHHSYVQTRARLPSRSHENRLLQASPIGNVRTRSATSRALERADVSSVAASPRAPRLRRRLKRVQQSLLSGGGARFATSPPSKGRRPGIRALIRNAWPAPTGRNRLRIRPHRPPPGRPGNPLRRPRYTDLREFRSAA